MAKIKWTEWLIFGVLMFLTINMKFSTIINNPNTMLLTQGGDGLKNYLTPMLHVKNSTSYNHFDSMNYPYGEHVLFTDNQPLISNILRFINKNITDVSYNTVGVLNYALLLSLLLSGAFLYYFFRRLALPHWYSVAGGIIIVWLSPQIVRYGGHYALGYSSILLCLLYFLLRFEILQGKWSIAIFMLILLASMLHFYYFGISAIFLSAFYFIKIIKNRKSIFVYAKHWAFQVIVPYIILNFIWLKIGNAVIDRPQFPYGILHYVTVWEALFFKPGNILYDLINTYLVKIRRVEEFESRNYIGFIATAFFFVSLIYWIATRKVKVIEDNILAKMKDSNFYITSFWASFLLLLFSMGLPYIIPAFEFLLNYSGPIRQFRGLGRFAWLFYYLVNIIAFYTAYQWINSIKAPYFRYLVFTILLIIGWREATTNADVLEKPSSLYSALKDTKEDIEQWLPYLDKTKYQAILPIPYYHLGAEYLGKEARGNSLAYSLLPSYYSGIPTMGVMMSRTSWQQTLNSIPLGFELYREPPVLQQLPNQLPLIAIEYKIWHQETGYAYKEILARGKKIHENEAFAIYELPIDVYKNAIITLGQQVKKEFIDNRTKLFQVNELMTMDSTKSIVYSNYDNLPNPNAYSGTGALTFSNKEKKVIFEGTIPNVKKGRKYNVLFWLNIEKGECATTEYFIKELNTQNEQKFFWHHGAIHNVATIDGKWALIKCTIEPQYEDTRFQIMLQNKQPIPLPITIDELLICPEGTDVFREGTDEIMKNNRWYK